VTTRIARRPMPRAQFLSPFEPDAGFENRLQKFFDDMFIPTEAVGVMPAVDIAETPMEYTAVLELPGLEQKDIEVTFEKGALNIKGEKRDEREIKDPEKRYHVWERSYGAFQRSFTFPGKVDEAMIVAEMKNGVLTIRLPKTAEETMKSHKIEIAVK
jgi:HSP20 family protein